MLDISKKTSIYVTFIMLYEKQLKNLSQSIT